MFSWHLVESIIGFRTDIKQISETWVWDCTCDKVGKLNRDFF